MMGKFMSKFCDASIAKTHRYAISTAAPLKDS
jgi:hypothetical protein